VLEIVESGGAIGRRGAAVVRRICISKRIIVDCQLQWMATEMGRGSYG
jgi:hypothetical protein